MLILLGFGSASALSGLGTEWDNAYLRCGAAAGLAIAAVIVFVTLWRDIETLYAPGNRADGAYRRHASSAG